MSLFDVELVSASFEGILFPAGSLKDSAGNGLVQHVAHGRPGADLEYTQERPKSGTIEVPLFNDEQLVRRFGGPLAPNLERRLVEAFRSTPIGTLYHPLLGSFRAGIEGWERSTDPQRRNGWNLEVRWIEHTASAGLSLVEATADADPATAVSELADEADTSMAASDPDGDLGSSPLKSKVDAQLAILDASDGGWQVAGAVATLVSLVEAQRVLFGAASAWATVRVLERLASAVRDLERTLTQQQAATLYTVPVEMSLMDVAVRLYGNGLRVDLLRQANAVPDELFVPPGTVLLAPPEP